MSKQGQSSESVNAMGDHGRAKIEELKTEVGRLREAILAMKKEDD